MNLHGLVSGAIGVVNPFVPASIAVSTGYVTNPDGSRTPEFTTVTGTAQVQALTGKDLRQIESLNLNGTVVAIYFFGQFNATVRPNQKGGDVITLTQAGPWNGTWLINMVEEQWPDWCKVVATLQNGS